MANPNQSLFHHDARYKSSLFWRYLAEQRSRLVDEPTIGVDTYRRVIEECSSTATPPICQPRDPRRYRSTPSCARSLMPPEWADSPRTAKPAFGNFALACYLKDLATPPDARFGFRENKENIHIDDVVRLVNAGRPAPRPSSR